MHRTTLHELDLMAGCAEDKTLRENTYFKCSPVHVYTTELLTGPGIFLEITNMFANLLKNNSIMID